MFSPNVQVCFSQQWCLCKNISGIFKCSELFRLLRTLWQFFIYHNNSDKFLPIGRMWDKGFWVILVHSVCIEALLLCIHVQENFTLMFLKCNTFIIYWSMSLIMAVMLISIFSVEIHTSNYFFISFMAKKVGDMFVTYFLICHPCSLCFAPMVWCPGPLRHYCVWSDNKVRELTTVCLPWQQWIETSVWFDYVGISAFHSCVVLDLWQSLSKWHLLLSEYVLVCFRENVRASC
jgi:hypothetical protein